MNKLIQPERSMRIVMHCVLLLALLLGQAVALGHYHDADQDPERSCALCLYAQQTGHAIATTVAGLPVQVFHAGIFHPLLWQQPVAVIILPFHSRAPPFTSC